LTAGFLTYEAAGKLPGRLLLHARKDVAVDILGDAESRMPQRLPYDLRMGALAK
jgi:hypothetical protein